MANFDPNQTLLTVRYPVVVVTERRPSASRWVSHVWSVHSAMVGAGRHDLPVKQSDAEVRQEGDRCFWSGLQLAFYKDQAEAYYHNLVAPSPRLFVISRSDPQWGIKPFLISASLDEAGAFMETDEETDSVPLPRILVEPLERFIMTYYSAEPRRKRKREDWKNQGKTK